MLKLIVFDWDGTLADSINNIIACKQSLAKKYDLTIPSEKTIKSVIGMKFEKAMAICFPNASPPILNKIGNEYHILMQQKDYQAQLFPDVKIILEILKKRNIKLAVATSKDKVELEKAIIQNDLTGIFDRVCCGGTEYNAKPDPAILEYLLQSFKIQPNECLMVGDTTIDITFAGNAGVPVVCTTFGAHNIDELRSLKPLALVDNFMELLRIIDSLCYSPQHCSQ